jgi:hypothetical protein
MNIRCMLDCGGLLAKKTAPEGLANVPSPGLGDRSFLLCLAFPDGLYDFIAHGLPKSQQVARVHFGRVSAARGSRSYG